MSPSGSLDVPKWLSAYREAWHSRDPQAAAALFAPGSHYHEQPYEEPFHGPEGVREYWTKVTSTQDEVNLRWGTPFVDGNRAAVEWWVTLLNDGAEVTLAGAMILVFEDEGLCSDLREYFEFSEGHQTPPAGWGE